MKKERIKKKVTLLFSVVTIISVAVLASISSPLVVASDKVEDKIQKENIKEKEGLKEIETNNNKTVEKDVKKEFQNVKVKDSNKETITENKANKSDNKKNTASSAKNQSTVPKQNKNNSNSNKNNSKENAIAKPSSSKPIPSKTSSKKPIVTPTKIGRVNLKSGVSQEKAKILNNNISTMPSILIKALDTTGLKVFLNSSLPNNTSGNFNIKKRAINFANTDYGVSRRVVAHEFGHFLDFLYDTGLGAHDSKEFKEIFNSEKNLFIVNGDKSYYISNRVEYFAQSFSEYICNPSRLEKNTPKTYNFVKKVLNSINDSKIQNAKKIFDMFS